MNAMLIVSGMAIAMLVAWHGLTYGIYEEGYRADQVEYLGPPPDICWNFVTCQDL